MKTRDSMQKFALLAITLAWLLTSSPVHAAGPDHVAAFQQLARLAGSWSGRMEDPLAGPRVTVRFMVASNGKAVVEIQNPDQPWSALTVYALAHGELEATHFSPAGNQPRWRLGRKSTDTHLLLELDGGRGLDAGEDGHVRGGEIRLLSADRIEQLWFHYVGPKRLGTTHWFLQRDPVATEAAP